MFIKRVCWWMPWKRVEESCFCGDTIMSLKTLWVTVGLLGLGIHGQVTSVPTSHWVGIILCDLFTMRNCQTGYGSNGQLTFMQGFWLDNSPRLGRKDALIGCFMDSMGSRIALVERSLNNRKHGSWNTESFNSIFLFVSPLFTVALLLVMYHSPLSSRWFLRQFVIIFVNFFV